MATIKPAHPSLLLLLIRKSSRCSLAPWAICNLRTIACKAVLRGWWCIAFQAMSRGDAIFRWRCHRLLFVQPSGLLLPMVFLLVIYLLTPPSVDAPRCVPVCQMICTARGDTAHVVYANSRCQCPISPPHLPHIQTVRQMEYGRIANAVRAYRIWNTRVHQMRYGLQMRW